MLDCTHGNDNEEHYIEFILHGKSGLGFEGMFHVKHKNILV